jgi:hypothetical protein
MENTRYARQLPGLTTMKAAMCGFLPALIYSKEHHASFQPVSIKVENALKMVNISESLLHHLIEAMFHWSSSPDIPDPLLFFVDSLEMDKIRWLPTYLCHLFSRFQELLPPSSYLINAVSVHTIRGVFDS